MGDERRGTEARRNLLAEASWWAECSLVSGVGAAGLLVLGTWIYTMLRALE